MTYWELILMPFDGIVTSNIVWELNTLLSNGKIEKIYQPENDEIIMLIRAHSNNYKLLISSSSSYPRIHLLSKSKNNPQTPPNFCMFLRKHLQGGRISSIVQKEFERVIELSIDTFNELGYPSTKKLIIEIMGKHSNIILLDGESNKILDSIKKISNEVNRYRQVLPGKTYVAPPDQGKISPLVLGRDIFIQKIKETNIPILKSIYQSFQGLSPFISRQICEASDIDEDMPSFSVSDEKLELLYHQLLSIVENIKSYNYKPCLILDNENNIIDFYAISTHWILKYYHMQPYDSISAAVEAFYFSKDTQNRLKQKSSDLFKHITSIIEKLGHKKQKLIEELLKAQEADTLKLYGELINANLYRITPGLTKISVENYYNPGEQVEIELDPHLSPAENAQHFFKRYNKAKIAYKEKNIQLEETDKDLQYFESVLQNIESAVSPEDIEEVRQELVHEGYIKKKNVSTKNKKIQSQPLKYTSSDGFTILVGKNNIQNDILTLKTASKSDIWMHTKEIPGSHVIISAQGKEVPDDTIREAAALAAYYSKGKLSENVPVDYTIVRNVKKPNGAKPGMVIYDHYNTIYITPKVL